MWGTILIRRVLVMVLNRGIVGGKEVWILVVGEDGGIYLVYERFVECCYCWVVFRFCVRGRLGVSMGEDVNIDLSDTLTIGRDQQILASYECLKLQPSE